MWDVFKFQLLSEFAREPEVCSQLLEIATVAERWGVEADVSHIRKTNKRNLISEARRAIDMGDFGRMTEIFANAGRMTTAEFRLWLGYGNVSRVTYRKERGRYAILYHLVLTPEQMRRVTNATKQICRFEEIVS